MIFGKGSAQEIGAATTKEKIAERIEELSKRERQLDEWEKMRQDAKRRQKEDRRLNLFWRRNKTFPAQFGGEEDTPDPKKHSTSGGASTTKKWAMDGEMTGPSEKHSLK